MGTTNSKTTAPEAPAGVHDGVMIMYRVLRTLYCRTMPLLLCGLLLTVPVARAQLQPAAELSCARPGETLLWRVEGIERDVHLFGSIHLGKADFYPLQPSVEQAFRAADYLVFEADIEAATADMQFMMDFQRRGMLPEGQRLQDVVSAETVALLEQVMADLGVPAAMFQGMQPWFLNVVLASMQMSMYGYMPQHGVELYLLSQKAADTRLLELESVEAQLGFLESLNSETYLRYTLESFDAGSATEVEALIRAWRCADKETLEHLVFADFSGDQMDAREAERLRNILFHERNRDMADRIRDYIDSGDGDYFVVVGAGHLLGPGSIIDLLQGMGYRLSPVRSM